MDRRAAIKAIGAVAAAALVPATQGDGYQPIGYLDAEMPLARRVVSVTLNGVEQMTTQQVRRGDDRAGWIEVFVRDEKGYVVDHTRQEIKREIRRGVVRFKIGPAVKA